MASAGGFHLPTGKSDRDASDHHERGLRVFKEGEDHPSSGFQKGDEIRQTIEFEELHPLSSKEPKWLSPAWHRREERDRTGKLSKPDQAIYSRVFSPSQASDQGVF